MTKFDIPEYGKRVLNAAAPSAGATAQAGKDSENINDALGTPGDIPRMTVQDAVEEHDVKSLREKQLGDNGYQGN